MKDWHAIRVNYAGSAEPDTVPSGLQKEGGEPPDPTLMFSTNKYVQLDIQLNGSMMSNFDSCVVWAWFVLQDLAAWRAAAAVAAAAASAAAAAAAAAWRDEDVIHDTWYPFFAKHHVVGADKDLERMTGVNSGLSSHI